VTRGTQLSIETRTQTGGALLTLKGELDMATAPHLEREIASAARGGPRAIVLDLRDLDFIDSTGLRALIAEHERSRECGRTFALIRGSKQVDRLLSITRVSEHLLTVATPEDVFVQTAHHSRS
jgi:anti-sigma B factor antagonist